MQPVEIFPPVSIFLQPYGISNKKIGKLEGFRHTFSPTIGMSYRPDFSEDHWGFYRTVERDTLGNEQTYSIFEDEIFRGPLAVNHVHSI